jgi:hypothetical protein
MAVTSYYKIESSCGFIMASITVFIGLAELLLIPVFSNKTSNEKNLKIVFLISGILNLLSAVPIKIGIDEKSGLIFLLSQGFLVIVMIICIKFFRQVKIKEYEE